LKKLSALKRGFLIMSALCFIVLAPPFLLGMKMKIIVMCLLIGLSAFTSADSDDVFHTNVDIDFEGHVAEAAVFLLINIDNNGDVKGFYYYKKTELPIALEGTLKQGRVNLSTTKQTKLSERFVGQLIINDYGLMDFSGV
jgi:hypothetical protein